jgi:hypothetical protein
MSFESRYQEECRIAFKSMNDERAIVDNNFGDSDDHYENGTDCYVKMPKESDHVDALNFFDAHESDCVEENENGEQMTMQAY